MEGVPGSWLVWLAEPWIPPGGGLQFPRGAGSWGCGSGSGGRPGWSAGLVGAGVDSDTETVGVSVSWSLPAGHKHSTGSHRTLSCEDSQV